MSRTAGTNRLDRGAATETVPAREQLSRFLLAVLFEAFVCVAASVGLAACFYFSVRFLLWLFR